MFKSWLNCATFCHALCSYCLFIGVPCVTTNFATTNAFTCIVMGLSYTVCLQGRRILLSFPLIASMMSSYWLWSLWIPIVLDISMTGSERSIIQPNFSSILGGVSLVREAIDLRSWLFIDPRVSSCKSCSDSIGDNPSVPYMVTKKHWYHSYLSFGTQVRYIVQYPSWDDGLIDPKWSYSFPICISKNVEKA